MELKRYEEFEAEILEPIILFVFHGISSGFLQAIGKDIWEIIKKKIGNAVAKERASGVSDLEFHVKTRQKDITFRIHSNDSKVVERAIDQFPKALESAEGQRYETDYYEFDNEKKEWTP